MRTAEFESPMEARLEPSILGTVRTVTFGTAWSSEEAPTARGAPKVNVTPVHVRDIMTRNVVAIQRGAFLKHAVEALTQHCITGLPVTDGEDHPVGVLSEKDVLRTLRELVGLSYPKSLWDILLAPEGRASARDLRRRLLKALETTRVQESMSSPPITIEPDVTVLEALRVMIERKVHRLIVVQSGKMVGIVTRRDIFAGMTPS